jgi:LPXTG-motif cell wall-anchored protein
MADMPNTARSSQWPWLLAGGLGGVLVLAAIVGWMLRGPAILVDMADFFCL